MKKSLKQSILDRDLTIGSWLTIGNMVTCEIMAKAGFSWLTVDLEHSAISISQAQDMIRIIDLAGVTPLVRVGKNEPNLIKRVMDAGSHGVIVPMVNTAEEAEAAVASAKYPPRGIRGVGLARAQQYGHDFEGYLKKNHEEGVVIVQVEHIKSVENLEDILSVEGVDGFIIGPYDLSGSLGVPGQFDHPDVVAALDRVAEISKARNALSGFHVIPPEIEPLQEKINDGYKFVAHSLDILMLDKTARKMTANYDSF